MKGRRRKSVTKEQEENQTKLTQEEKDNKQGEDEGRGPKKEHNLTKNKKTTIQNPNIRRRRTINKTKKRLKSRRRTLDNLRKR